MSEFNQKKFDAIIRVGTEKYTLIKKKPLLGLGVVVKAMTKSFIKTSIAANNFEKMLRLLRRPR